MKTILIKATVLDEAENLRVRFSVKKESHFEGGLRAEIVTVPCEIVQLPTDEEIKRDFPIIPSQTLTQRHSEIEGMKRMRDMINKLQ